MYSAVDLSKYIVTRCFEADEPISNLQLQKILYFIQREWLVRFDFPAFSEPIQAWRFGPVVPNVYYLYCGNGAMPIKQRFPEIAGMFRTDEHREIVNRIVDRNCQLDPWDLVAATHASGGAWDRTFNGGAGNKRTISWDDIRKFR